MIEIRVNKDVGSYEAKLIGPFTARQTVCVCIAAPFCWFIYHIASPVVSSDVAGFFMALPAAVAWLFGWTKPYGMRAEKFLQSVWVNMVLAPTHRKYKTVNIHEQMFAAVENIPDPVKAVKRRDHIKKKKSEHYKVSPEAVK